MPPHGVLNLNKPPGMTSRDVVNRVQRIVRPAKAGHAGTLDPLADGVLVVCIGAATRLIEYVQRMPKAYRATFLLGRESPTDDIEGEVRELESTPIPMLDEIITGSCRLVGRIEQRPPAYSALKVQGQRAYALARSGQSVELAPRPVDVYRLEVVRYDYPELELEIECSSGTYVRALGRDLAQLLGTAAVMSALVRTAVGGFRLKDACPLDELTSETLWSHLLPPLRAVEVLPQVRLSDEQIAEVAHGRPVRLPADLASQADEVAAVDQQDELIAVLKPRGKGQFGPVRNLRPAT